MTSAAPRGGSWTRDPVSELFDSGARRLLARAYRRPGEWVGTRLADPAARHVTHFGQLGIDVLGRDRPVTVSGEQNTAHTRWGRGFVRALYYQHRWYAELGANPGWRRQRRMTARRAGSVEVQWGRRVPATGVIPAGRAVRVRYHKSGARRAVRKLPESERIYDDRGNQVSRAADVNRRDW